MRIKCPNGLSKADLLEAESIQIGVPMLLAIAKRILGRQYYCERPWIRIHTCAEVYFRVAGMKSFVQGKSLRIPLGRVQAFTDLTLCTSSNEENANSKNPLPRDVTPPFAD